MQPSETAFDRVKSLLGKMDRSIDDARRRRLHEPDEAEDAAADNQPDAEQNGPLIGAEKHEQNGPTEPARPTSKYGRARPLREVNGNGPSWQTA